MDNLIARGAELAIFGMGTVFVFLTLLVLATMAMSAVISRYAPEPLPGEVARPDGSPDATTLAAIAAAVRRYRQRQ